MSANAILFSLFILLISADASGLDEVASPHVNGSGLEMRPMIDQEMVERMVVNGSIRRRLGTFQVCAPCNCCGGLQRVCVPCPCCYVIQCNIPNRPFGYCSFTPKDCNCRSC